MATPVGSSLSLLCDPLLQGDPNANATADWFHDGRLLGSNALLPASQSPDEAGCFAGRVSGERNLILVPSLAQGPADEPNIGLLVIGTVQRGERRVFDKWSAISPCLTEHSGKYWCRTSGGQEGRRILVDVS